MHRAGPALADAAAVLLRPAGVADRRYDGPVTFRMNGEEVQVIPIRRAHTDGDTLVRFREADALMTGDYFRSVGYPNIDRNNGGTLEGMIAGLGTTIGLAGSNTKVIPGHGPVTDRAGVIAHLDMIHTLRDRVIEMIGDGKTEEEIVSALPTAEYDSTVQPPNPENAERFLRQLYAELTPAE